MENIFKKFFNKKNAIKDGALLVNQTYEEAVAALTGTPEEIETKTKDLQAQRDQAIEALSKPTVPVKEAKEVRVEFVSPKGSFNYKRNGSDASEVYSCADVQEAVDAGDEDAIALVKELVEIKSGVIQVVPVN